MSITTVPRKSKFSYVAFNNELGYTDTPRTVFAKHVKSIIGYGPNVKSVYTGSIPSWDGGRVTYTYEKRGMVVTTYSITFEPNV